MTATLPPITYGKYTTKDEQLLALYEGLLRPRMIEEKMLKQLRQGIISKWFSGIGQEAISVGCAAALDAEEYLFTMHRNLGVFTTRDVPPSGRGSRVAVPRGETGASTLAVRSTRS